MTAHERPYIVKIKHHHIRVYGTGSSDSSELISTAAVCNLVQHGPGETGLDAPALMTHVASCNIHNQECLQPKSTNNITE